MKREVEWAPISAFINALNLLNKMLAVTPEYSLFEVSNYTISLSIINVILLIYLFSELCK